MTALQSMICEAHAIGKYSIFRFGFPYVIVQSVEVAHLSIKSTELGVRRAT